MFPSLLKSFNIKKKQSCSYSITCTRATSQYSILHSKNQTIFCLKSFKTHAIQFGDAYQIHFNLQNFERTNHNTVYMLYVLMFYNMFFYNPLFFSIYIYIGGCDSCIYAYIIITSLHILLYMYVFEYLYIKVIIHL